MSKSRGRDPNSEYQKTNIKLLTSGFKLITQMSKLRVAQRSKYNPM